MVNHHRDLQSDEREEEEPKNKMRSSRSRKGVWDYKNVAEKHGFEWVGDVLPATVLDKTKWKCKANGHIWETRYSRIYEGRTCPYCNEQWHKKETDYHKLAEWHGIRWVGETKPSSTRITTEWEMPDGERFQETYRNLAARRRRVIERPQIALRKVEYDTEGEV